jgi:hypothetical protein
VLPTDQQEKLAALRRGEVQGAREGVEHGVRRADPTLLQAGVVVDAHTGALGDFFSTESWNPTPRVGCNTDLLRSHLGPTSTQEFSQLFIASHLPPSQHHVTSPPGPPHMRPWNAARQISDVIHGLTLLT